MSAEKKLYFFGCGNNEAGHYWFGVNTHHSAIARDLKCSEDLIYRLDGMFCPKWGVQGQYIESNVGHVKIISWCDYTVDKRPGSNSNLVGIGYESAGEMITDARLKFPSLMSRQTELKPLTP